MKYNKKQLVDQLIEIIENSSDVVIGEYTASIKKYDIELWVGNGFPFVQFYNCGMKPFPLSLWDKIRIMSAVKQASINKLGDKFTKG